jgi:thiol-disulfide isomerase/thioredoxin
MRCLFVIFAVLTLFLSTQIRGQTQDVESMEPDKNDDHNFLPLGEMSSAKIISGSRIYNMRYVDYVPNSDAVQTIHNCRAPVEIKVFWGDWCKDSKKYIPGFIKSLEFAENNNISVTYINLDLQKKEPAEAIAGWNIQNIPTFVVLSGGKEIGRIVETPKATVEQDLAAIITPLMNQ